MKTLLLLALAFSAHAGEPACTPALTDSIALPNATDWSVPVKTAVIQHCAGNATALRVETPNGAKDFLPEVRAFLARESCGGTEVAALRLWSGTWAHLTKGLAPLRFRFNLRCRNGQTVMGRDVVLDFSAALVLDGLRLLNCSNGGCEAVDTNG
jgi:hypothetical protein